MKYYVTYEMDKGFVAKKGGYVSDPRRAARSAEPVVIGEGFCIRVTQKVHEDHADISICDYPAEGGYRARCPRCKVRTGLKKTPEEAMKRYSGTPCIEARYTLALYIASPAGHGPEMVLV